MTHIDCPLLAVTGEQDIEVMRSDAVRKSLASQCKRLVVTSLADCRHHPMQEAPPLLVAIIERFLAGDATGAAVLSRQMLDRRLTPRGSREQAGVNKGSDASQDGDSHAWRGASACQGRAASIESASESSRPSPP